MSALLASVGAVLGIPLTILTGLSIIRQLGWLRVLMWHTRILGPLSSSYASELVGDTEIRVSKQLVDDPYITVLRIKNLARPDIKDGDFQEKPLVFDFHAPIALVAPLDRADVQPPLATVTFTGTTVEIAPMHIPARRGKRLVLITDGPPHEITGPDQSLLDIKIRRRYVVAADVPWIPLAILLPFFGVSVFAVAAAHLFLISVVPTVTLAAVAATMVYYHDSGRLR
jgi:hypothetical protein